MMRWLPISLSTTLLASPVVAAQAQFIPLGDLPGGNDDSCATATNADGSIVVGFGDTASGSMAFRWSTGGSLTALGTLQGDTTSAARDVSADGSTIVGESRGGATGQRAFRWSQATGMSDLGANTDLARGVNADGSVIIGTNGAFGIPVGWRWEAATGAVDLPASPGLGVRDGRAVSADGTTTVGFSASFGVAPTATLWNGSASPQLLGTLGSGPNAFSTATGVDFDGSTVVGSSRSNAANEEAFVYTATGGMVALGSLPGGPPDSRATSVSLDGSVIVGHALDAQQNAVEAFIWTQQGGMQRLADVLIANGATGLSGWTLVEAMDVSDLGNAVVGWGINNFGDREAFVAYLGFPPDPSTSFCAPAVANSTGQSATVSAAGSDVVDFNALTLIASGLPVNATFFFLTSRTQGMTPQPGGSQGILCLGGSIGRFVGPGQVLSSGASGSVSLDLDLTLHPLPTGLFPVLEGETWSYQGWYRDANPGPTSNFTDGASVTFR